MHVLYEGFCNIFLALGICSHFLFDFIMMNQSQYNFFREWGSQVFFRHLYSCFNGKGAFNHTRILYITLNLLLQQHLLCGVSGWTGEEAGGLSQPAYS